MSDQRRVQPISVWDEGKVAPRGVAERVQFSCALGAVFLGPVVAMTVALSLPLFMVVLVVFYAWAMALATLTIVGRERVRARPRAGAIAWIIGFALFIAVSYGWLF